VQGAQKEKEKEEKSCAQYLKKEEISIFQGRGGTKNLHRKVCPSRLDKAELRGHCHQKENALARIWSDDDSPPKHDV
jgi:hypothetical protein